MACSLDVLIILGTGLLASAIYNLILFGAIGELAKGVAAASVVSALVVPGLKMRGMYKPTALLDWQLQLRRIAFSWTATLLFLAAIVFALKIGKDFSRGATFSFAFLGLFALAAHRIFWARLIPMVLRQSNLRGRDVILISDQPTRTGSQLIPNLLRHGYQIRHHFYLREFAGSMERSRNVVEEAIAFARDAEVDEIFVSCDLQHWADVRQFLEDLRILPLPVSLVPDSAGAELVHRPVHQLGNSIAIELQRAPLTRTECALKRATDILGAALGLVLLAPLLLIAAIAIKLDSPGPVLFRQRRHGFNGRPFKIFKFRTMKVLEDDATVRQVARNDDRVTRVGVWLRRTSIDELPQLFNVLMGEMSLVGPRPHAVAHDSYFAKLIENYAFRHHVKPGITGWAQVNGFRGETPRLELIKRRVELDISYVDNWSIWLDCSIIMRTMSEIVRGRNAY